MRAQNGIKCAFSTLAAAEALLSRDVCSPYRTFVLNYLKKRNRNVTLCSYIQETKKAVSFKTHGLSDF